MLAACEALWPGMDGCVAAAAVADQRPEAIAPQKVKKGDGPEQLTLVRTPDILLRLGQTKRAGQWLVGFAAESEQHLENAAAKLQKKRLDVVLMNDIANGAAWGWQANALRPVTAAGPQEPIGPLPKDELARRVVAWWAAQLG
jgi:phosphopantothenoylcysteine decarboxylase/phosphopantothenate--cysteine ligase